MKEETNIPEDKFSWIVSEILSRIEDIPKENSIFQESMFVANEAQTPERMVRAIWLRAMEKINALRQYYFSNKENNLVIEALERDIKRLESGENKIWDKVIDYPDIEISRKKSEIEKILSDNISTKGLIKDALVTLAYHYEVLKQLPKYTREEFEKNERNHFEKRLISAAQLWWDKWALQSLHLMQSMPAFAELNKIWINLLESTESFVNEISSGNLENILLPEMKQDNIIKTISKND